VPRASIVPNPRPSGSSPARKFLPLLMFMRAILSNRRSDIERWIAAHRLSSSKLATSVRSKCMSIR